MTTKNKNTIYLVEVGPAELKSFDNWPDCQRFVHGMPYAFAGGATRVEALTKLKKTSKLPETRQLESGTLAKLSPSKPVATPGSARPSGSSKPSGNSKSSGNSKPSANSKPSTSGKPSANRKPPPEKTKPAAQPAAGDKPKNNFYVVETAPDVFKTFTRWSECKIFIGEKPYAFAGGVDEASAMEKLLATREKQYSMRNRGPEQSISLNAPAAAKPKVGLCSDAGTHGNPGPCEYKVTTLKGEVLDHKHLGVHSNNYAELAGIGAMVKQAIARGETQLWTDSKVCMIWLKSRKLGPTVLEPELLLAMIDKINRMLREHPEIKILKWDTRRWGQIPADFGRK